MSDERFSVAHLDEIERKRDGRWILIRAHFDIEAFAVNAYTAEEGAEVILPHTEIPSGQQELYVVIGGHAVFTVDGEEVDAPAGTLVFAGDPKAQRKAVAREDGTVVLALGAKPGEAYRPHGGEWAEDAMPFFESGDYERAYEALARADDRHPNMGAVLYNLACAEARIGKADEAVAHLRRAVELWDEFREIAREDPDFESIRTHPEFVAA